jgi:hypothetical protein
MSSRHKVGAMKNRLLFAAATAFVFAAPAGAKPGNGHGDGHGYGLGFERPHQEHDWSGDYPAGYGAGGCPPGLAKKHNGCMPPGQAKRHKQSSRLVDLVSSLSDHRR